MEKGFVSQVQAIKGAVKEKTGGSLTQQIERLEETLVGTLHVAQLLGKIHGNVSKEAQNSMQRSEDAINAMRKKRQKRRIGNCPPSPGRAGKMGRGHR